MLDEPTNALDANAEEIVHKAIKELCFQKLSITLSNRTKELQNCERILVLGNKKIVEEGTFDSLIKARGVFAKSNAL